jgi:branched-chain amino acid transport system substrate-binding protein
VVKKFRDAKIEPEGYTLYAYAAFQLFEQAANAAKTVKYAELNKAMHNGSFDTVIGKLSFDAKGNGKAPAFVVYQWKDGKYATVK